MGILAVFAGWVLLFAGPRASAGVSAGQALDFDGIDDAVTLSIASPPATDYTLGAWVLLRSGGSVSGVRMTMLSAPDCGGSVEFMIRSGTADPAGPQFLELGRCNKFDGILSTNSVPLNVWTHVAVTVSAAKLVTYFINGEAAGKWALPVDFSLGSNLVLGNGSRRFDGQLDEVQIWSRALSPSEIGSLWRRKLTGNEAGLLAYYSLDAGSGTTAVDGAGAGGLSNGVLKNGTRWVTSGVPLVPGATVTPAGIHPDLGPSWRSQGVAKPLDVDGDAVLGTDGYQLVNLAPVLPSTVADWAILSSIYPGNGGYLLIDDPVQPGEMFLTGTMNPSPGSGGSADPFSFRLSGAAEGRLIRVGLLVDNLDGAEWNAAGLSLVQVNGNRASGGPVPTVSPALNNRVPDWVFFDIRDGRAGDEFVVRAVGGVNGTATVGGVAFDSVGPVGGLVRTSAQGVAGPNPSRIVLGEPPSGSYKMTLTLSNVTTPSQGLSVLLVGPGGQKVRPMAHAFGTFAATDGPTVLTFDDEAPGPLPVLVEGSIPGGVYRPDTDQSPGNLPAPAPSGPYAGTMAAAQVGQVAGVWSLYVAGTSVRVGEWRLEMVPLKAPVVERSEVVRDGVQYRGGMTGAVNPGGLPTVVWVEWGTGPQYGSVTPAQAIGAGNTSVPVEASLGALSGGTFHLRMVASNRLGVSVGAAGTLVLPVFSKVGHLGPKPLVTGAPALGDFDNNGMLDVVLAGDAPSGSRDRRAVPELWQNTRDGFLRLSQSGLPPMQSGSASFGDLDNDGRPDFLVLGQGDTGTIAQAWRNTGVASPFIERADLGGLAGVGPGAVAWGDFDHDGRLDFLLTGHTGTRRVAEIWRNSGAGFVNVTASVAPGLPAISNGSAAWGDYDGDGWLDLLMAGSVGPSASVSQIWRNTGGAFTQVTGAVAKGLAAVEEAAVAWGDYDNDGRLDFVVAGDAADGRLVTQIWRNTGTGFANVTAALAGGIPGVGRGTVAWGDHDNDGRLDLLLAGRGNAGVEVVQLWRNAGNAFVDITAEAFPDMQVRHPSAAWGDVDNDGRLDVVVSGETLGGEGLLEVWRSRRAVANTPPTAPTGLSVAAGPAGVTFSWNAASDAQTAAGGLSYHLRVGTTPGGSDVVSAMAGPDGWARVPRHGALRPGRTRTFTGLPAGRILYWTVQAQDTAFAGSAFAVGQQFTLGQVLAPTGGSGTPGDTNGDGTVDAGELAVVLSKLGGGVRTLNESGYYSLSQVQALNVGRPLLSQVAPGQFKLTLGLETATRLTNFVAFPFVAPRTTINAAGEVEYLFSSPDDAAFYRLESR